MLGKILPYVLVGYVQAGHSAQGKWLAGDLAGSVADHPVSASRGHPGHDSLPPDP
jgi:hypothetical protein